MAYPQQLTVVSYLAPNWFWFYQAVTAYIGRTLGTTVQIVQSQFDPLEDPLLLQDQLDIAFICGLPFIRYHQIASQQLQALAAPVMRSPRYQNRPVYFSDVIVSATSSLKTFADLRGKTFCYNDPGSNSGYNLLHQSLMQQGFDWSFFSKTIQSKAHQHSIRWVVEDLADCAAIDSTVLEQELYHAPELATQLRVIEAIGPSPMPPVVVAQHLGPEKIDQVRKALLNPDAELQAAMQQAEVLRYAHVPSEAYATLLPN